MKASLRYRDTRYGTQIAWCADDDDCGANVGQDWSTNKNAPAPDRRVREEAWEVWTAEHAARPFANGEPRVFDGFTFTRDNAAKAMRAIKAALKAKRPLLEWEKNALAAGWVPPKGWAGEVVAASVKKESGR